MFHQRNALMKHPSLLKNIGSAAATPKTTIMKNTIASFLTIFILNISYSQNLNQGLMAYYSFDGHLLDHSIYQNDLRIINGPIFYNHVSSEDLSVVFNGDSRVSTIQKFDTRGFREVSISFWFRSSTITNDIQVMLQGAYLGFGIYLAPHTGKAMAFFDGSSSRAVQSKHSLSDGAWHHIVATSNGRKTSLYVDGVFQGDRNETMKRGNGNYYNKLFFGRSNLDLQPFIGTLDEVRIYNRILSQKEIDLLLK